MVLDAFEMVMDQGPLAREPCMKMKVSLTDIKLHEDAIHSGPAQVYPAVREAITEAMRKCKCNIFLNHCKFILLKFLKILGELLQNLSAEREDKCLR